MNIKAVLTYAVLILLIIGATYRKAPTIPYLYDDKEIIQRDGAYDSKDFAHDLFSKNYYDRFGERTYRPVATASFMIDKKLWNLSPEGTHVFNVLLHALVSISVFLLLTRFGINLFWAFWGGVIFAVHPVKIEAVALASNREDLLCALFFFLSLFFYIRAGIRSRVVSWLLFALALFSKEMAASLPIAMVAYNFYFYRELKNPLKTILKSILGCMPYLLIIGLFMGLKFGALSNPVGAAALPGGSASSTLMIMSGVFMKYSALLIYPVSFCADYVVSRPANLIPVAGLVFFILLALTLWKYGRTSGYSLAFFLIALLPVSNIFPFGETMAERYLYIPSFALSLGVARMFYLWRARILKIIPAILIVVMFAAVTDTRLEIWQSEESYWSDAAYCAPDSSEAWTNLGNIQLLKNDPALAMKMYEKAAGCSSFVPEEKFFYNLGLALYQLGDIEKAESAFIDSVNNSYKPVLPYYQLAKIKADSGEPEQGLQYLEAAIKSDPKKHLSYYILAHYCINNFPSGVMIPRALSALGTAISLDPENALYHAALAQAQLLNGDIAAAVKSVNESLRIQPNFPAALSIIESIKSLEPENSGN